jgi:hypothetical protein
MAGAIALSLALSGGSLVAGPAEAAPPVAPDDVAAGKLAATAGKRVEVESQRTEFTQVFAEPDGTFTHEAAVVPQRVRQKGGSFKDIDLTLAPGSGDVRPRVSAADVRFSDGGAGPLVKLVRAGRTFTVTWPLGRLPEPDLDGDSATYPEVLPDVDLVVRATADGFTHVLRVNTATAAKNAKLKAITFELGGDARVRQAPDGLLTAVVGSDTLASAATPMMWDSASRPAGSAAARNATTTSTGEPSTAAGPADTARSAELATTVTGSGDLVLKPDATLMSTGTFPVFIDPAWSTGKSRWAYATNNNSTNSDISRARVGKDPEGGRVYRSFFEFPTTGLKGKYVYDAYVQIKLDHSWSCTNTPTSILSANPIGGVPRTAWKTTGWYVKYLAQVSSHSNEGTGCGDSPQPDPMVNFHTNTVIESVRAVARAGASTGTYVLSAVNSDVAGESVQDRWKKFFPDTARLITNIDSIPGKPTQVWVNGVKCGSSQINVGTTAVKFSAVLPDADTTQAIRATWSWQRYTNGAWTAMTAPATSSTPANTTATSATLPGVANGQIYRFQVTGTDPAPYNQTSPASAYCQFKVDLADPDVKAEVVSLPTGPGKPGQFRISSTAGDLVKFRWGWNAAVNDVMPDAGTKSVTRTLTAPKYGSNTLYVQAVDSTGNVGDGSVTFDVDRPSPPVARWGLETHPGASAEQALADQQPALAGDTPLSTTGVSFTDKQRLVGGATASLNGSGVLSTPRLIDTSKSYAVAAWVRLDKTDAFQNIIAQDGAHTTNFQLQYRNDNVGGDSTPDKSYCFAMRTTDVAISAPGVFACAPNSAVAGKWTHVAASFDSVEQKMRLWIDGALKSEVAAPAPWASAGTFRVGNRMLAENDYIDYLTGGLAEVQVFDRALVQEDLTGKATDPEAAVEAERGMLRPIEVARWDFEDGISCFDPTGQFGCEEPDGNQFGRRLHFTHGVVVATGVGGRYGIFDNQFEDDPALVTKEYGVSQRNTGDAGTPQWVDGPVLRTDQSFTVTARVQADKINANMTAIAPKGSKQSAFSLGTRASTVGGVTAQRFEVAVPNTDADVGETYTRLIAPEALIVDDAGLWYDLTVVHDAGTRQMSFYVNGIRKAVATLPGSWQASGPLAVGAAWSTPDNGTGGFVDNWFGGIDDIRAYQGAMTEAQIAALLPPDVIA